MQLKIVCTISHGSAYVECSAIDLAFISLCTKFRGRNEGMDAAFVDRFETKTLFNYNKIKLVLNKVS